MENETFATRKNFLENYFKEKIRFLNVLEEDDTYHLNVTFKSNILQKEKYDKTLVGKLKEITYFLNSKYTNEEKILTKISIDMIVQDEEIVNTLNNDDLLFHERTSILRIEIFYKDCFLLTYENLLSSYFNENDFIPHPTKNFNFLIKYKTIPRNKIINENKCFKTNVCMICLTNTPGVLFCNCGHICMCSECYEIRTFNECVHCKTKNEIVRILE